MNPWSVRSAALSFAITGAGELVLAGVRNVTGGGELENRMHSGLRNEFRHRRVLGGLEIGPRGAGDSHVFLQDRARFGGRDLPDPIDTGMLAAAQRHAAGGARIEHPRHRPVRATSHFSVPSSTSVTGVFRGAPVLRPTVVIM